MFKLRQRKGRTQSLRQGVSAVELALILPLLMLLVFGAVQSCNTIHLKQAMITAAFEGSRVVSRGSATRQDVLDRCGDILRARNVTNFVITFTPDLPLDEIANGETVAIRIDAPTAGNVVGPNFLQFNGPMSVESFSAR